MIRKLALLGVFWLTCGSAWAQAIIPDYWRTGLGGAALEGTVYPAPTIIYSNASPEAGVGVEKVLNVEDAAGLACDYEMSRGAVDGEWTHGKVVYKFAEPVAVERAAVISDFPDEMVVLYKYEVHRYDEAEKKWKWATVNSGRVTGLKDLKYLNIDGGAIIRRIRLSYSVKDFTGQRGSFTLQSVSGFRFWGVDADGDGCSFLCDPMPGNESADCVNGWPGTDAGYTPCECFCCNHETYEVTMEPATTESGTLFMLQGKTRQKASGHTGAYARSKEAAVNAILNGGESFEQVKFSSSEQNLFSSSKRQGIAVSGGWSYAGQALPENLYHYINEYRLVYPIESPGSMANGKAYLGIDMNMGRDGMGVVTSSPRITIRTGQIDRDNCGEDLSTELKEQFLQLRSGVILWQGTIEDIQKHPYENELYHLPINAGVLVNLRSVVVHFDDVTLGYNANDWVTALAGHKINFVFGRDFEEDENNLSVGGGAGKIDTGDDDDGTDYVPPHDDDDIPDDGKEDDEGDDEGGDDDDDDDDDDGNGNGSAVDIKTENPWEWLRDKESWTDDYTLKFEVPLKELTNGMIGTDIKLEWPIIATLKKYENWEQIHFAILTGFRLIYCLIFFLTIYDYLTHPLG